MSMSETVFFQIIREIILEIISMNYFTERDSFLSFFSGLLHVEVRFSLDSGHDGLRHKSAWSHRCVCDQKMKNSLGQTNPSLVTQYRKVESSKISRTFC